jgi:cytochrome c2
MLRHFYLLAATIAVCTVGCRSSLFREAAELTGGDPGRGRAALERYGCTNCHTVSGLDGAIGRNGPALDGVASRNRLAGGLENTPENMIRWIRDPRSIDRYTSMPNLSLSPEEARDIAAFLYTLK